MATAGRTGSPALLATKLHAPRPRREVVERPRLTDRLARATLPSLTVVSAPAGFGKTTLLADWVARLRDERCPVAWLSLDPADNDPARFWSYLVEAIGTAAPGTGDEARALLAASEPIPGVVASLLNDLAALGDDLVVVVDDHHVIDSAEVHETLAFLVDHLPPLVHLVLAGRADPALPLGRIRARGELLEVRAADLRFTGDEATAYLNGPMGLTLADHDVEALESRTEGWIAALQLAALSIQGRSDATGFIATFAGDDRFVVDFLVEEVLERQPDDVREFLLDTSILGRFTGSLCDAVTGTAGGTARLERLDRANLFLVALDDRRRWYRYHHLFAQVLHARLAADAPERADELHRRASAWYEEAGEPADAIAHAMAAHDVDRAARLVELAAPAMFQTRQEWTARRWLSALPDELFPDRPVLSIELVGALMVSGEITGVERLLDGIERWLEPGADPTGATVFDTAYVARLPAQVAIYRAALALIAGDPAATIGHARRALALADPTDHLQRGSAAALVGLAEWTGGDLDAASRLYVEAIHELTAAGHISDVLGCSIALADMRLAQGRLGDAAAVFESALALAGTHGAVRGTADMHVGLAEVLLELGDLAGAREHLAASERLGEQGGLPQHPYRRRVATARLRQAEGDGPAALHLLEEAEAAYDTDMSPPVRPVAAVRARALLAEGDVVGAGRWALASGLGVDDELDHVREYEHVTLARVLLAQGRADDAVRLLERVGVAAEAGGRSGDLVDVLVALATARSALGDRVGAAAALEQALAGAAPEGWLRPFTQELPALAPLLAEVPEPGPPHDLARTVLAVGAPVRATPRSPSSPTVPGQGLVDPLSTRELDVLRMLRGELSGPEIADEMLVSLNTVRTHTRNIYVKLGVNNRREAVRRAAELGL